MSFTKRSCAPGATPWSRKENEMKANLHEPLTVALPEGFTVRGAALEDVESAIELFNRWSQAVIHEDEITDAVAIRTE